MKYLRTYNESQSDYRKSFNEKREAIDIIMDLYQDFFDEFGYEVRHRNKWDTNVDLWSSKQSDRNNNPSSFRISENYLFGGEGHRIRISHVSVKKGGSVGLDGVLDIDFKNILSECHERCISHLGISNTLVGSFSLGRNDEGDLDIFYFKKKPNFNKFKGVDIYGSTVIKKLDLVGGFMYCNMSSHDNCFDYYKDNGQINGMFSLWGYYSDKYRYNTPLTIISGKDCDPYGKCNPCTPIEQWVSNEWDKVCDRLEIKNFQTINWNRPKIIVPQFLNILGQNQEIFKTYTMKEPINKRNY